MDEAVVITGASSLIGSTFTRKVISSVELPSDTRTTNLSATPLVPATGELPISVPKNLYLAHSQQNKLLLLGERVKVPFFGCEEGTQVKLVLSTSVTERANELPIASSQVIESSSSSIVKTRSTFPLLITGASFESVL